MQPLSRVRPLAFVVALAMTACGGGTANLAQPVAPLAKVDAWRSDFEAFPALVEVAYDRPTAEQAWRENVPGGLPRRGGEPPHEEGVYADLADVDFDSHAVIVWSSGQSGFDCWGWLSDIQTQGSAVKLTTDAAHDSCTDDYNAYSMVLAVERNRLPPQNVLPVTASLTSMDAYEGPPLTAVVDTYPSKNAGQDAE